MTFCYSHKPMPYPVIREASYVSRCEQMQRPKARATIRQYAEIKFKEEVSIKSPQLRAQGILGKQRWKDCKSQRGWRMPEKQGSLNELSKAQVNWHRRSTSTGHTWFHCGNSFSPQSLRYGPTLSMVLCTINADVKVFMCPLASGFSFSSPCTQQTADLYSFFEFTP